MRERADLIVQSFSDTCPLADTKRRAPSRRKIEDALGALYRDAAAFSREQHLGILNRARFAKAVQDGLLSRGYPADLVVKITSALSAKALASSKSEDAALHPNARSS